jgi:DNA polymerase-3 subunit beta
MQITVNRAVLAAGVAWAMRAISSRPAVPVLAGMRAEVADGKLTLAAFDYEMTARSHVFGADFEPGSIFVTGAQLAAAVKSLPAGKKLLVKVTADESGMTLECTGITSRIPALDDGDYPAFPPMPPHAGTFAGDDFGRAFTRVAAAAGGDWTLPSLTCVQLETGPGAVTFAATDRYRLAVDAADWTPADLAGETQQILIPAATGVQFVKAAKGAGKIGFHFSAGTGFAGFATDERELIVRAGGGEFPRYKSLIPAGDGGSTVITVNAAVLADAVTRAGKLTERNEAVRLTIAGDASSVLVQSTRDGEVAGSQAVAATTEGVPTVRGFNAGYLAQMLAGITGDAEIAFRGTSDQPKPAHITPADTADRFQAIVMPIRIAS